MNRSPTPRRLSLLVLAAVLCPAGCGDSAANGPPPQSPEGDVENVVSSVPDLAADQAGFNALFVGGKPPAGVLAKDYVSLRTEAQAVEIAGDRATAQVAAAAPAAFDAADGDAPALPTAQWTLVRNGDAWLLESAPLP